MSDESQFDSAFNAAANTKVLYALFVAACNHNRLDCKQGPLGPGLFAARLAIIPFGQD